MGENEKKASIGGIIPPPADVDISTISIAEADLVSHASRVIVGHRRTFRQTGALAQTRAELIISDALKRLGAKSATFYVPDQWQPRSLRLAAMVGVHFPEPMHGFMLGRNALTKLGGLQTAEMGIRVFPEGVTAADSAYGFNVSPIVSAEEITRSTHAQLFGNFAHREKVRTCVCLSGQNPEVTLWINFDVNHLVTDRDKQTMRHLCDQLERLVHRLDSEAASKATRWIMQSIHILNCMGDLTPIGESLESYLESILLGVRRAYELTEDEMSDVLMFRPDSRRLEVVKRLGPELGNDHVRHIDVRKLEGISSWVAIMQRAIVIADLKQSPFGKMHVPVLPETASQLTVPLISGSELLGVLNLESPIINRFPPESVRPLWYAANQAVVAYRLVQQAEWTKRFIEIAHRATSSERAAHQETQSVGAASGVGSDMLKWLAELAKEMLGAGDCDIWHYNRRQSRFERTGATYEDGKELPRKDGWSQFIKKSGAPVWIFNVRNEHEFESLFWNRKTLRWEDTPPHPQPSELNKNFIDLNAACEIGIPLVSHKSFMGVAWIKFRTPRPPPLQEFMTLAHDFAAEGGLIMDLYDRYNEAREQAIEKRKLKEFSDKLFKCGDLQFPGIECHVIRRPCGELGGDFHNIHPQRPEGSSPESSPEQVNFFIGDTEGHGLGAGLNMLPIITTFRVVHRDSESTKHTLRRLLPITTEGGHRATALYFVVRQAADRFLLFASSSGHPPVIIYRNETDTVDVLPREYGTNAMLGDIPPELALLPLAEELAVLKDGDVLVAVTDGVLDAGEKSSARKALGRSGLNAVVFQNKSRSAKEIAEDLERVALEHDDGEFKDDVTIMVVKIGCPPNSN